jgi:hypothetical protein
MSLVRFDIRPDEQGWTIFDRDAGSYSGPPIAPRENALAHTPSRGIRLSRSSCG